MPRVVQEIHTDLSSWDGIYERVAERLGNCSASLFPSVPSPLPSLQPLEVFAGNYSNEGYGAANVELRCDAWETPPDSPASPSQTPDGCRLVITKASVFGKQVSYQLEHKSGELWIGWFFNDDFETVRRPTDCFRVQFRLGEAGRPAMLGMDIRQEGEDVPLTWFRRND